MKTVTITRTYQPKQTIGELSTDGFRCKTIELTWKDNQQQISCIPEGEYICKFTKSNRLNILTYEITNVKNRSGVRIHSANFSHQLRGCIALGYAFADIDKDGLTDVTSSRNTIASFEKHMEGKDFKLIIRA